MNRRLRRLSKIRLLSVVALLLGIPAEGKTQSNPAFQWQVTQFAEQGTLTALLVYAVPETDNALFRFLCAVGQSGPIQTDLYIDARATAAGAQTDAAFHVDGTGETRPATIVDVGFGPQVRLVLDRGDRLWGLLKAGSAGQVAAGGGDPASFDLTGSHAAISDFLGRCAGEEHGAGRE